MFEKNLAASCCLLASLGAAAPLHERQNQKHVWTPQKSWYRAKQMALHVKANLVCRLGVSDSVQKVLNYKALHFRGLHRQSLPSMKYSMHLITHLNLAIVWASLVRTVPERAHCSISLLAA